MNAASAALSCLLAAGVAPALTGVAPALTGVAPALTGVPPALAGGGGTTASKRVFLVGSSAASFEVTGMEQAPPTYGNNGFAQSAAARAGGRFDVNVEARLDPLPCRDPFPIPADRLPREIARWLKAEPGVPADDVLVVETASQVAAGTSFACDAVSAVIGWVAGRVRYSDQPDSPRDAREVLVKREASCVGRANLAAAMLRSLGIPCRTVSGIVLSNGPGFYFHRWIEVYYVSEGWVFSDPGGTVNFVGPEHVLLDLPERGARGDTGSLGVTRRVATNDLVPEDVCGSGEATVRERRSRKSQCHAAVTGVAALPGDRSACSARLEGLGLSFDTQLDHRGRFHFLGLEGGTYTLEIRCEGRVVASRTMPLGRGELVKPVVSADGGGPPVPEGP